MRNRPQVLQVEAAIRDETAIPNARIVLEWDLFSVPLALTDAIHEIALLADLGLFDQAMNVGVEAGEPLVEAARELEVFDDGPVEPFAGNEEGNPRRIRREQHA